MTEPLDPLGDETAELAPTDEVLDRPPAARVNLLPAQILVERRQRRVGLAAVVLLVAYLAALGGIYAYKVGRVNDARAERDTTEQQVAALRTEAESLHAYQQLLDTVESRERLLTNAMDGELSWARILGDLALSFDRQSSLIGVQAASTDPVDGAAIEGSTPTTATTTSDAQTFDLGDPVAQIEFTGYSVDRFAPGVEEVLARFDDADGFDETYLSTAGDEERGATDVTNFIGRVQIDRSAYTHRYDDGLPEESLR